MKRIMVMVAILSMTLNAALAMAAAKGSADVVQVKATQAVVTGVAGERVEFAVDLDISRTWHVRWTTNRDVAKSALPPNANITALVCSGLSLPKLSQGVSKFSTGHTSCAAINTPTSMPTIPQTTVITANCRTTL